jgi:hypothetical protein
MIKLEIINTYICKKATLIFFLIFLIFTLDRHHRFEFTTNKEFGPFEYDVAEYYSYLPTFFYNSNTEFDLNCKKNKRTIGMAIMYLPAFISGDAIARSLNEPINGYSYPYQLSIRWWSICITFLGLWFTSKSLLMFFSEIVTGLTLTCIFYGTNLFFYTYSTGESPHSYLFFLYSIFLYFSFQLILYEKTKMLLFLGIIGGMIFLIRPTAGLIIFFPLLFKLYSYNDLKQRIRFIMFRNRFYFFGSAILFLIPLLFQMLIWYNYHGSPFYYSYIDERFFFDDPQILNFLFSFQKGWFIYTPIMIFSVFGLLLSIKNRKDYFIFSISFLIINIYILSCWWDWGFGGSFGCRTLIESYAILAVTFAVFIKWSFSLFNKLSFVKLIFRFFLISLFFILIKLNIFQTWQYKYNIIHWSGMNEKAYKFVFLKESLSQKEYLYLKDSLIKEVDVYKRKNGFRD